MKDINSFYKHLDDVNFEVNRKIKFSKAPGWQFKEWPKDNQGFLSGDCDSYAATKASELIRRGVDPKSLAVIVTRLPDGQDHAVLRVISPEKKYRYLDNRRPQVSEDFEGEIKGVFPQSIWHMLQQRGNQEKKGG